MFGTLGGQEIIFILVLALIVFGPRKLPEIGKSIGRMMAEFRKASNDFRRTLEDEVEAEKARPVEPPAPLRAEPPSDTPPSDNTPVSDPRVSDVPAEAARSDSPAAAPEGDVPGVPPVSEPTVARPEPAGVGRPDGPGEPH
jgi:TatA/E family protein of Tat protein translocase